MKWLARGLRNRRLEGEKDEKLRNLTSEANFADRGSESQTQLKLGVKENFLDALEALDKSGQQGGEGRLEGGIDGSEVACDVRATIDAIDALVELSDFGEAMGAT